MERQTDKIQIDNKIYTLPKGQARSIREAIKPWSTTAETVEAVDQSKLVAKLEKSLADAQKEIDTLTKKLEKKK